MSSLPETLARAIELHRGGKLAEAEAIYREILAADPGQPDAWHLLGLIAHQSGQHEAALEMIGRALSVREDPAFDCNLGSVLNALGRHAEAVPHFERSLTRNPNQPKAWYNYGNALRELRRAEDAAVAYQKALALQPDYPEAHTNLGVLLREQGKLEAAIEHYRAALAARPTMAQAHFNLGNALRALSESSPAAISISPRERVAEVVSLYQEAIRLRPDYHEAHSNLGVVLKEIGRLDEAVAAYQAALQIRPDFAEAHSNLALAYQDLGLLDEAERSLRRALELKPDYAEVHSNLVFILNYNPAVGARELLDAHRNWATVQTRNIARQVVAPRDANPDRPLRIGFVSPDLRTHPVGRFIAPLLEHLDREQFSAYVYADVEHPDAWTGWLRDRVAVWRHVLREKHDRVAERVVADEIDILIDLAGHTAFHRLPVFARRVAPVQISYLGYPNTTGLDAIDYYVTDSVVDPPGSEAWYTEKLARLDPCFSCYLPPNDAPPVNELPARASGTITFGALHNLAKLNDRVFDLWASLLHKVGNSRLLLFRNTLCGAVRLRILNELVGRGIAAERIDCRYLMPAAGHLAIYHEIDIALDVFPWSGHTTACEALWMGAPVVTLATERHAGRMVASVLNAVGRREWIAHDQRQYLDIAARLASEIGLLAEQRAGLREAMRRSPQCDGPGFARRFESLLRQMWREQVS